MMIPEVVKLLFIALLLSSACKTQHYYVQENNFVNSKYGSLQSSLKSGDILEIKTKDNHIYKGRYINMDAEIIQLNVKDGPNVEIPLSEVEYVITPKVDLLTNTLGWPLLAAFVIAITMFVVWAASA